MKQTTFWIILLLVFNSFYSVIQAQNDSTGIAKKEIKIGLGKGITPNYYVKLYKQTTKVDSIFIRQLKQNWILRIEIIKDKKYKNLFDSPIAEASMIIHIKKRYVTLVTDLIKNSKKTD